MANLAKYANDVKIVDDLKEPTLGHVIKDETALMFTWVALGISAILYIPGAGFISALAIAYFGYRDVNATCKKERSASNNEVAIEHDTYEVSEPSPLPVKPQPVIKPIQSEFIQSPWGRPLPQRKEAYQGEVYVSPEDKLASVAVAEFRAPDVQELLKLPIKKRAEEMLRALKLSGCNLRPYIHDKVIIATGTQRSGKSTIVVLIGILEAALLGKQLRYITSDGDIYPVAFSGLANGEQYYSMAADEIKGTKPNEAAKVVWIFDEVTKQSTAVKESLWEQLLTGFVKTGASARLITHGTTMKAIGFAPGMADQVKSESVIIKALRKSDVVGRDAAASLPNGGQHPSGEYRRQELVKDSLVDVKNEQLQLPDWLLFDTNDQGNPCYVRTLLKYFPELDTRETGLQPPSLFQKVDNFAQARQNLESTLAIVADDHPVKAEIVTDDDALHANAYQFAQIVCQHLSTKDLRVVSLARLLADNYDVKRAFKGNSADATIREKGKMAAWQLALKCKAMGLLKVDVRSESSMNLSKPDSPLFGAAK